MQYLSVLDKRLMLDHLPQLTYVGSPAGWPYLPRLAGIECVYHLFDAAGDVIYVGLTANIRLRLQQHARRPWWPDVALLHLYAFVCYLHENDPCDGKAVRRAARLYEARAIRALKPKHNISGKGRA